MYIATINVIIIEVGQCHILWVFNIASNSLSSLLSRFRKICFLVVLIS